jgi:hypothetical protein
LLDPDYILSVEEEQALANRNLLFISKYAETNPELRAMIETVNQLRFGVERGDHDAKSETHMNKII